MNSRFFPLSFVRCLIAFAFTAVALTAAPSSAQENGPTLTIDAGTEGNTATTVGRLEDCISVGVGDRFDVDMVIEDVTELLAWEASLEFDAAVVRVVDHDVKLFQEANAGSSVIDISAQLPDDSGFHTLSAFDSSDPPAVDSGSGVLGRLTLEATGEGRSLLRFGNLDINGDGVQDRGTLLKDADANVIGDETGDDFFDGERRDAMVVVGDDCPDGSTAAELPGSSGDGTAVWPYVGAAAGVLALAALGFGALLLVRRRGAGAPADTTEA